MSKSSRKVVTTMPLRLTQIELNQLNYVRKILNETAGTKTIIKALFDLPNLIKENERLEKYINQLKDLTNEQEKIILQSFTDEERKQANAFVLNGTGQQEPEELQSNIENNNGRGND